MDKQQELYYDEKIEEHDEYWRKRKREACDHEWQRMGVLNCQDPIETGWIGGSEIIMITIRCYKCEKPVHLEGAVE